MDHTRHTGIFDVSRHPITLIGAGGIGGMTALTLAKMGVSHLFLFDPDYVGEENLATQFFRLSDVGKVKVDAITEILSEFSDDTTVHEWALRIDSWIAPWIIRNPIVISAVDSINARKDIWGVVKDAEPLWYLDARMSAETFQLYAVDMNDCDWFDRHMDGLNEEDVPELPCTAKATYYCAMGAGALIGNAIRKIVTGQTLPRVQVLDFSNLVLTTI